MSGLKPGTFMMYINNRRFEWDPVKAEANLIKHGVRFEEAITVFHDLSASIEDDLLHSILEHRQLITGESDTGNTLVVVFTERWEHTRIISARKANRKERGSYEEKN